MKSLRELLKEGTAFNIAKIDIKSFYESVNVQDVIEELQSDAAFSRQSISVLKSFFSCLAADNIPGLPRGIGLSATLSEYLLRSFDAQMRAQEGAKFYSRYVDDMIVISHARALPEEIIKEASHLLPKGLSLNRIKTKAYRFKQHNARNDGSVEGKFAFLGYDISVSQVMVDDRRSIRQVTLDIATKKVDRLKRRMCKAILEYNNGGSFADLIDRFKLLTSNFGYEDGDTGQVRYAGIRYNYGLIDPSTSHSLNALDRFTRNIIASKHPNNRIRPDLNLAERHAVLSLGYKKGFVDNRFFAFKQERLDTLVGCWRHA